MDTLFQPYRLNGTLTLADRFMLAPLTRCMEDSGLVPPAQMFAYSGPASYTNLKLPTN